MPIICDLVVCMEQCYGHHPSQYAYLKCFSFLMLEYLGQIQTKYSWLIIVTTIMILKAMVKKKCLNPKLHRSRVAENPLPGKTEGRAPFGSMPSCGVAIL